MTTPVVVAVDPEQPEQAHDAVTMAARLAELLKAPLQAVHIFAPRRGELGPQFREHARSVKSVLQGAQADAEVMVYPGASPARVLHHLCDIEHARCVFIGSGRRASEGTSSLGEVAEALLHGSRVPVIVVPAGYGSPQPPITDIGIAYGGTPESDAALAQAQELVDAVGGRLTVIAAEDATTSPSDGAAQLRIDRALASAPEATGVIADGDPTAALAGLSSAYDLLVAGSRSYGPLRVVLLGAVTRRLLEQSHCPVMIVARLPDAAHEVALVGGMETALDAQAP